MSDIIVLDVAPEAAILNSGDASLPIKARQAGTNQPIFLLKYSETEDQRAFWSWPVPSADDLGEWIGTAKLILHWSANTTDALNVQFGIQAGYSKEFETIDKALAAEVLSPIVAFTGTPLQVKTTEVNLTALFSGLGASESARLVLAVRRNNSVGTPLVQQIQLLKSQLLVHFKSKLELEGPIYQTIEHTAAAVDLGLEHLGKHSMFDTDTAGFPTVAQLPNDLVIGSESDGKIFRISRKGAVNLLSVQVEGGGATTIRGAVSPVDFFSDGDILDFMYVSTENVYQVV